MSMNAEEIVSVGREHEAAIQKIWKDLNVAKENPYPFDYQGITSKAEILIEKFPSLSGCDVLDIGCNSGVYSLLAGGVSKSVHGTDVDNELVERAWAAHQYFDNNVYSVHNVRFSVGNFVDYLTNSVNAIIASCVLYHVGDKNIEQLKHFLSSSSAKILIQARPARDVAFLENPTWGTVSATKAYNGLFKVEDCLNFIRDCGFNSAEVSGMDVKFYGEYFPVIFAEK